MLPIPQLTSSMLLPTMLVLMALPAHSGGGGIHSATGCSLRVFFVGHARRHDLHGRFRDGCEVPLDRTTVDVRFFSQIQPYASQLATMEAGV
jgi:hypothetical protein